MACGVRHMSTSNTSPKQPLPLGTYPGEPGYREPKQSKPRLSQAEKNSQFADALLGAAQRMGVAQPKPVAQPKREKKEQKK